MTEETLESDIKPKDVIITFIVALIIGCAAGYLIKGKSSNEFLTGSQIADNLEFILFEDQWSQSVLKGRGDFLTIKDLKFTYNMYDHLARDSLVRLGEKICNEDLAAGWENQKIEVYGTQTDFKNVAECAINDQR